MRLVRGRLRPCCRTGSLALLIRDSNGASTRTRGRAGGTKRPRGQSARVLVTIATDGFVASDGAAGWAFVAHGEGLDVTRRGELSAVPPHLAEWRAMLEALTWAEGAPLLARGDELEIRTDSALIAKGLASRKPAMSGQAAESRAACRKVLARLAERGIRARVIRVPREANTEADLHSRRGAGK